MITKDTTKKSYEYYSRYSALFTVYNSEDSKRYYELSKQLKDVTRWVTHTVGLNDTLDTIALKYYGNPLYWWIIADINHIQDPFDISIGDELKVPYLSDITF